MNILPSQEASNGHATISITAQSASVTEGDTDTAYNSFFTIHLSKALPTDTTITIAASSALATTPGDYTLGATSVTILSGSTDATVALTIAGDVGAKEPDKSVRFTFTLPTDFSPATMIYDVVIIDNDPLVLTVNPFYPVNGANWNDYIVSGKKYPMTRYYRGSTSAFPATDVACDTASSYFCWHGGEIKKVVVSSEVSCANLTMEDSESAFTWRCQENGSNPVYFYSTGFNKGKKLVNFLTTAGDDFKTLKVILKKNGTNIKESALSKWWTNPIVNHNGSSTGGTRLNLNTASVIHTFSDVGAVVTTKGIDVSADKVAIVVMNGMTLSADSAPVSTDCRPYSPSGTQSCIISLTNKNFTWVEGKIDTLNAPSGYYGIVLDRITSGLVAANYNRFHGLDYYGKNILLSNVFMTHISDGRLSNIDIGVVEEDFVSYPTFSDLIFTNILNKAVQSSVLEAQAKYLNIDVSNSANLGIYNNGGVSVFDHVRIHNVASYGFNEASNTSVYSNLVIANTGTGIYSSGTRPTYNNVTSFNNGASGINFFGYGLNMQNAIVANNDYGLYAGGGKSVYHDIFAIDNGSAEITLPTGVSNVNFFGQLMLGRMSTPCNYQGTTTNVGVSNSTCAETGTSDFTLTTQLNGNDIFQGVKNDAVNAHGASGAAGVLYSAIVDWTNFESMYRVWGRFSGTNTFYDASMGQRCSSGNCMIFDAKTSSSWSYKNFFGSFVNNSACPDVLKGSNRYVNADTSSSYLKNATEFLLDGVGDDDGLCESNEVCYFNPNPGAMMDDPWAFTNTCTYNADGSALVGIKIYGP